MTPVRIRTVGFVGTGIMGAPICEHLLDAGYRLYVNNRTREKAERLVERGAIWCDTPADAAREADVTFTMVGYPTDVEDVYLGKNGILSAARKGSWMVDLTTSSPELARELHDAAEVMDKHAVDCPVTGGQAGAEAGTLTLMLGCDEMSAAPLADVLATFSSKVYHFGRAGQGQVAKLCNQVSFASCIVGYADALALAKQSGLDADQVIDMICDGMEIARQLRLRDMGGIIIVDFIDMREASHRKELYDVLCQIGGSRLGGQALTLLYEDEATGVAAGLDWSLLEPDAADPHDVAHGGHAHHDHECGCGHHHDHDHECGCGHHHEEA